MKYLKSDFLTKLIIFAILLAITASLCACTEESEQSDESVEESSEESFVLPAFSQEELPEDDGILTVDEAIALLKADNLVTDIFINQSLCADGDMSAEYKGLPVESEYVNFKAVTALLENTYTADGGCIEEFLNYPEGLPPAVTERDGRTFVFNHPTERFSDPVFPETATVSDTDVATEKTITATTRYSNTVTFKAVLENGRWRLEKGAYALDPFEEISFTEKLPFSDIGSFRSLSGELLVIEFFVTDKQTEFSYEEEIEYHGRISTAVEYLVDTADEYGKTLTPTYKKAYFQHEDILGARPLDFDIMFAETGFGALKEFAQANYDLTQYDNYVFVVCLDKDVEASCALYENTDQTKLYYGERVIIGNQTDPADICAKLFKLMGAYGFDEGLCDEYTESLYHAYYKNDIMISGSLAHSVISPVTAYACGLIDSLDRNNSIFYFGQ